MRGEAALAPPSARAAPPSLPPTPGDPLVSPPLVDDIPSRPLFAKLSTLVGGDTERSGLCASRGGEVLNWTGGRGPVVNPHTSSSLLPESVRETLATCDHFLFSGGPVSLGHEPVSVSNSSSDEWCSTGSHTSHSLTNSESRKGSTGDSKAGDSLGGSEVRMGGWRWRGVRALRPKCGW